MDNARAQLKRDEFAGKHPDATKVRVSKMNENRRWQTISRFEPLQVGDLLRFQAFKGRHVLGSEEWAVPEDDDPDEPDLITPEIVAESGSDVPLNLILSLFNDRIQADGDRIAQLHQMVKDLTSMVSTHQAGAQGSLLKLVDNLTGALTEHHSQTTSNLARRLTELDRREAVVIEAEETAESRLIEADTAKAQNQQEGAVLGAVMEHLAPKVLEDMIGAKK